MNRSEEWLADYQAKRGKDPLQKVIAKHGFTGVIPKKSKYRNQKVTTDEGTFDSKHEYAVWCQLKARQAAGEITGLQRQVVFILIPSVKLDGRNLSATKYLADFVYYRGGKQIVEDAKGMASLPDYKIKRKLMMHVHGIEVVEIRKNAKK